MTHATHNRLALAAAPALAVLALCALPLNVPAQQTNIDLANAGNKYAYGANSGWMNLQGDLVNGIVVRPAHLSGWAWSANLGWICFGLGPATGARYTNGAATDFGVNNDAHGGLSGYAWGCNIGWIAFDTTAAPGGGSRVSINPDTGAFQGYAWSANCGWISFDGLAAQHVAATDPAAVSSERAVAALRDYLLGRASLPQALMDIADFNSDGAINVADISFLIAIQ